jgi:antitoxin HicB
MATVARRALDDYLTQPYTITVARNGAAAWVANVEELPGCTAREESPEKATESVRRAMRAWIETALDEGREIPAPRAQQSFSGRLLLRMPSELHGELSAAAEREGTSLNQFIVAALGRSLEPAPAPSPVEGAPATPPQQPRLLVVAIVVNLVAVVAAGAVAIGLLIAAWQGGF